MITVPAAGRGHGDGTRPADSPTPKSPTAGRRSVALAPVPSLPPTTEGLDVDGASRRRFTQMAKGQPEPRPVEPPELGEVVELPVVGGVHHLYTRRAA